MSIVDSTMALNNDEWIKNWNHNTLVSIYVSMHECTLAQTFYSDKKINI